MIKQTLEFRAQCHKMRLIIRFMWIAYFLTAGKTIIGQDTIRSDTVVVEHRKSAKMLEAPVFYDARDSVRFDLVNNKVFLFGKAVIKYQKITLEADYIEVNFNTMTLFAKGLPDSTGRITGTPVFTEGSQQFRANSMSYNFETKRGLIQGVITQEGEGFLHGQVVKRLENDITNVKDGSYTTCNLDHPHFEFRYKKAKVIPDKKIVTGPVYLTIEDVALPVFLPFGMFPNKKGQTSGILTPSWGESANRGFYLENGGYYWGISQYAELYLRGDIYTRGSWALKPSLNYRKRYKYTGNIGFSIARNIVGQKGTPGYENRRDFSIRWSHAQDAKAHPTQRFNANVNIVTSKFNRFNPVSVNNYLSNTFQSSITYQNSFAGNYFLNIGLNHSQNTITHSVTLATPDVSFSVNRFYPFRRKTRVGSIRWYENISMNYNMNARNEITTIDSMLFRRDNPDKFRNGIRHTIPIQSSLKVLKHFTMSNSLNYNERWYFSRIEKRWVTDTVIINGQPKTKFIADDTLTGFRAVRDFDFRTSISSTIYGLVQFRKGPVRAIRHVVSPSVGFSLRPDFGTPHWGYWGTVQRDTLGNTLRYSYYQSALYGTAPDGRSGSLNIGINNNLEAKVRSAKDTITGVRKIKLLDFISLSTSYDFARDSLRWSGLMVSSRTTLFKNLNVQFNGRWSPYATDTLGRPINRFIWETERKLLRRENTTWNFSMSYNLNSSTFGNNKQPQKSAGAAEGRKINETEFVQASVFHDEFVDWNQPWNLNINYSLMLTNQFSFNTGRYENKTVQTLSFNGDVSITPKWKVVFNSGYDFESKKISYTSLSFYRDLHCWEMRFNWIPFGGLKSWNFQINAKSSMLQDLKLTRKKDFRDY